MSRCSGPTSSWRSRRSPSSGGRRAVATLLTQLIVAAEDPAFRRPQKLVGRLDDDEAARRLARERNRTMVADGRHCRCAVPSPEPLGIVELGTIRLLVDGACSWCV